MARAESAASRARRFIIGSLQGYGGSLSLGRRSRVMQLGQAPPKRRLPFRRGLGQGHQGRRSLGPAEGLQLELPPAHVVPAAELEARRSQEARRSEAEGLVEGDAGGGGEGDARERGAVGQETPGGGGRRGDGA